MRWQRPSAEANVEDQSIETAAALIAAARAAGRAGYYKVAIVGLRGEPTPAILGRGSRTTDPLMLWILHVEMQRRGVPPCLRWQAPEDTRQQMFITFIADVLWLARGHPDHVTDHERWRKLFGYPTASEKWQRLARWLFVSGRCAQAGTHYYSKGLGLSDSQRQPLMMLLSNKMRGDRRLLNALPTYREALHRHALMHRDKSGKVAPSKIAERRAELLRLFILAGRRPTLAADFHLRLWGIRISRQALTRQITTIEIATGLRLRESRI